MKKITPIEPERVSEAAKESLALVSKKMGRVPNMYLVMANSPAVLNAYVKFQGALSSGSLGSNMAELIALATAESNACSYCLSAHTYFGNRIGLSEQQMTDGRTFYSQDDKTHVALLFAKKMLEAPSQLTSEDIEPLRFAGFTDGEILEVVANVIRNIFTNYINIISETEVDWPQVVTSFHAQEK